MRKKYMAYLPVWFVLILPPLVLLLLGWNFIMCGLGFMIGLLILGLPDGFIKYSKNIFKLWGISFLLDLVAFIFLIVPEIFSGNKIINTNLVKPLEYNPYSKIFSIIYMVFIAVTIILLATLLIKKFIIKDIKTEKVKMRFAKFVILVSTLPYLMFIPSTLVLNPSKNNLEDFKGTIMGDKSDIVTIMKYLSVSDNINSYVLDTHSEPYSINLYLSTIDVNYIQKFEMDAATIFNLVDDVNQVNFTMDGRKYSYSINKINEIFDDVKNTELTSIFSRYKSSNFTDYIYLDHLGEYDLFDTSESCDEVTTKLFTYKGTTYYLECGNLSDIVLFKDGKKVMDLKEAIDNDKIDKDELIESFLQIETDKDLNEDNSK